MALASTYAVTVEGVSATLVTVEANVGPGLPGMHMVGLGDAAVKESRERIRTACSNTALPWPRTKIMVSLSPAHLPKAGSHFDLPIALAVLGSLDPVVQQRMKHVVMLGELALDGSLRRVENVLPMLLRVQREQDQFDHIVVPRENEAEAALLGLDNLLVADDLLGVWRWLLGSGQLDRPAMSAPLPAPTGLPDFRDIAGQKEEREALEVAAAGGHHVLMVGPPGSGKSMLAERIPSILPEMSVGEMIEATALHSASGVSTGQVITHRPFIAPHPSLSKAALIGGGSGIPRPGAVSQAHHGVLFLDEASEIQPAVLDSLRIPLERREVRLLRGKREVVYPADFQLVLAANPCRCGKEGPLCTCKPADRMRHLSNISGPLRDRLDITLRTSAQSAVVTDADAEPSSVIAGRVLAARERSAHRWRTAGLDCTINAQVGAPVIRRHFPAEESAMVYLETYLGKGLLTQRGVDRVLKLAWTLADLGGTAQPELDHVAQAIGMRASAIEEVAA